MPSLARRFLLTTCFSVLVLGISVSEQAKAGFEWIPPEKAAPQPADAPMPIPKGSALPMPAPEVEEEILRLPPQAMPQETPIRAEKPIMRSRVMDGAAKQTAVPRDPQALRTMAEEQTRTVPRRNITPSAQPTRQPTVPKPAPIAKPELPKPRAAQPMPAALPMPEELAPPPTPIKRAAAKPMPMEQAPDARAAKIQEEPTSSVPRRKRPDMPPRQAQQATRISSEEPRTAMREEAAENQVAPASGGLKIDPYPERKATPKKSSSKPVILPRGEKETKPLSAGDEALRGVYQGEKPTAKDGINWNAAKTFAVAEGFGSDIPLALALGQIVPPSFAYSFGDGVNPGKRVSWEGGKPWNEVLADVLQPLGLTFEIDGQRLLLRAAAPGEIPPGKNSGLKKKLN